MDKKHESREAAWMPPVSNNPAPAAALPDPMAQEENGGGGNGGAANLPEEVSVISVGQDWRQEMRMASKTPSEWLRLLCRDWAQENEDLVSTMDERFLRYKSYLKGQLTSQLLCRLSLSGREGQPQQLGGGEADPNPSARYDFWKVLGVDDEFDRAHIVASVERFCSLYNIRGFEEAPSGEVIYPGFFDPSAGMPGPQFVYHFDANGGVHARNARAQQIAERNEMRRIKAETREREKEEYSLRKAAEKAARDATREETRQRKIAMKKQREDFAQRQKDAALRRAAELVRSDRVPIEVTRGAPKLAGAATNNDYVAENSSISAAAAAEAVTARESYMHEPPPKKSRSSIVISTASDLDQIVTHSNNLWAKYNAIAKEHNQRVNWVVVAKELGIHVKVREKYARMHSRAKARGFDFVKWGHYRIKDYPQYFTDPLGPEQEAALAALGGAPLTGYGLGIVQAAAQQDRGGLSGGVDERAISLAAEAASLGAEVMVGMKTGGVQDMPRLVQLEAPQQEVNSRCESFVVEGTSVYKGYHV